MKANPKVVAGVVILAAAFGITAFRVGSFRSTPIRPQGDAILTRNDPAPELRGLSTWFNSQPKTLASLRGKVVLIDFWTYSCINCVRTFPEIRSLHATYKAAGLEVIGIHSPEFAFEKQPSNVARAVREKGVTWPVAMDSEMKTWRAFGNNYWPRVYLIDRAGRIRFDHIGEGGGERIERAVRRLLGGTLPTPQHAQIEEPSDGTTPEIYLGYERGSLLIGNAGGFARDKTTTYQVPEDVSAAPGRAAFFLDGVWRAGREAVVSGKDGSRILLTFTARNVFLVGGSEDSSVVIDVLLDGKPITGGDAGDDVRGGSFTLGPKDVYSLARLDGIETHQLTLRVRGAAAAVYTFTFG